MKKLIAVAMVAACAAAQAAKITVKNFDEDLGTVYVNDVAVADGESIEVEGQVTVELKDFRNDYYFRFAPASQEDRELALDYWEGMPEGCENSNPAVFTVDGDLTITPNFDVKGFCWEYQEVENVKQIVNHVHRWGFSSVTASARTLVTGACIAPVEETSENNLVFDCVERVRYTDGKLYTIVEVGGWSWRPFKKSRVGTWALAAKHSYFDTNLTNDDSPKTFMLTNIVNASEVRSCSYSDHVFYSGSVSFAGPATNFIPRNTVSFGNGACDGRKEMTGALVLDKVQTLIGFSGCSGLASLIVNSPDLKSITGNAFSGCTKLRDVAFTGGLSNLTAVSETAFAANVTNFAFTADPPANPLIDAMVAQQTSVDGAHACRLTVDATRASAWNIASGLTANEIEAGLPANCMGAYANAAGGRKAWVVASASMDGILLVGDMMMTDCAGFVPTSGLAKDETVELTAPAGYESCKLQKFVNGVWTTYETVNMTAFTYTHPGELVRAVWFVDGARLTTKVNGYGGTVAVDVISGTKVSDGVYSKGAVVRLTATGRAEHPTSHFAGWTGGATGASASVEVTLNEDTEVTAEFAPDEWIYTNATQITDGEWTITSSSLSETDLTVKGMSGGNGGLLLLDLSLPIHPADDLGTTYEVVKLDCSPPSLHKLKVGPALTSFCEHFLDSSTTIEDIFGLGATKMTGFPYCFLYKCGSAPLAQRVYEANDFIPPGMNSFGWYNTIGVLPHLKGTLEMNAVSKLYETAVVNVGVLNDYLYKETLEDGTIVGVTNLVLSTKDLQEISGVFNKAHLKSLTIGSTNLVSIASGSFSGAASTLTDVTFTGDLTTWTTLASGVFPACATNFWFFDNPPQSDVLDNLVSAQAHGDSTHNARLIVNPGCKNWWNYVTDPTAEEIAAGLPENCMGVFKTFLGARKAWIVGTESVGGVLLVGDMTMTKGCAGFTPTAGLHDGDTVELVAPGAFNRLTVQKLVDGVWTFDTAIDCTSYSYVHDGRPTRVIWSAVGAVLDVTVNGYGGSVAVELVSGTRIAEGVYSKGSVVRLTATGRAEHPTSHLADWTGGASGASASVEVTLDEDTSVTAEFAPDEWIYTSATQITDGEWTITKSTLTDDALSVNEVSGGQNGTLWLDFSVPVHPYNDLETTYVIKYLRCRAANVRKLKLGPEFLAFDSGSAYFMDSKILEDIYGLGASSVTVFPYAFLCRCGGSPLPSKVYEANDFVPPGLQTVAWSCDLSGAPYLVGTLELNAVTNLYKTSSSNFSHLNGHLYKETLEDGTIVGVTNMLLTAEGLERIDTAVFNKAHLVSLTLGSTNLQSVVANAFPDFKDANGDYIFRSLTFLAHPPTVAALDNLVKVAPTTNLTVYASKFVPGWKAMRAPGYTTMDEWAARPSGCWGIYQTADGKKRYYLVQKDSKYDDRKGFAVILK